jgi:hypothetical protein
MMRRVSAVLIAAVGLLVGSSAASAHHSYAATYDTSKDVKLEGKLVQFVYRNPHTFVHVQTTDDAGKLQRWAVEWSGTSQLDRAGVTRDTLKIGDSVVVTIHPSRVGGDYRGLMVKLVRPSDGFIWGQSEGQTVD